MRRKQIKGVEERVEEEERLSAPASGANEARSGGARVAARTFQVRSAIAVARTTHVQHLGVGNGESNRGEG